MSKTRQFRQLLNSGHTEFLMEAHNGLSAKIAQEAGFRGLWASGLSIAAALGVRDNNEASWTQVLEVVEFMADATDIPILLDGDTGYGNFNNMRRLVRKLEQRGVAAVCIEDKLFPKTNSFIDSERQPLADMAEFAGKIKAAKDGQQDADFAVIARLEGFIAGWGLDEMLRRAEAYHAAGADALLIHSKKSTPGQILAFAAAWHRRCPLVIVPTMYYSTPAEVFEAAGINLVIWANHNVRASIAAMQQTCRDILQERSVRNIEDRVAPVKEIFRLQNAQELLDAEERYLPKNGAIPRAVVLAAGRGPELGEFTRSKPKAMVPVGGQPLLHKLAAQFRKEGVRDLVVVRGFGKDEVDAPGARFVDNDEYQTTGELYSLAKAAAELEGPVVVAYGDILFRRFILGMLLAAEDDLTIVVDAAWRERTSLNGFEDHVRTTRPHSLQYSEDKVFLTAMDRQLPPPTVNGEWIGLLKATAAGSARLREALEQLRQRPDFARLSMADLFNHLLARGQSIRVLFITGHWLDVDSMEDLARAQAF